jgi:hypothetical protein
MEIVNSGLGSGNRDVGYPVLMRVGGLLIETMKLAVFLMRSL